MNRSLWLLTLCQGLFLTNNVCFIAMNSLVGFKLAPYGWLATLPIGAYVLGGALAAPWVSSAQSRLGRQAAFQSGLVVAVASALLCAYAAYIGSFWLLSFATLVAGYYNANAQLYRFAAAELSSADKREKVVSWVLAGGLIGAIFGPIIARRGELWITEPFVGAYLSLAVLGVVAMLSMSAITFPQAVAKTKGAVASAGRSTAVIARQPVFIIATLCSGLGYGIMSLLMAATPLAMQQCGLSLADSSTVITWHVVGMFAPGFFTGNLIKRYGVDKILWTGLLLNALCVFVALSGLAFINFWVALVLLGIGWNFLFTAGTTLLMDVYQPEEKDRTQGANNFFVFVAQIVAAFGAGALVVNSGWTILNWASLVFLALIAGALVWLQQLKRQGRWAPHGLR